MKLNAIYETAKDTDRRLAPVKTEDRVADKGGLAFILRLDPLATGQKIIGFGGALTESSGYVLGKLNPAERERVLRAYFDPTEGIGYTLARTHINSCDFSLDNWACADKEDDDLASFSMARPERYQLPQIADALRLTGGKLKLMLTPWSPPAWMKSNGEMNNGGTLLPKYRALWARYFVRFIDALKSRGIPTWCVSVQNEPEATQTWDSCRWTGTEEGVFASLFLGPELERAGYGDVPILAWDHNRDRLWERISETMAVPGAERYVGGAAYHWYSGDQYDAVAKVAEAWPDKILAFTEGCVEGGPRDGAWFTGERYAHNVINDLNAGCSAWIDWNVALDLAGGPNHVGNYCDAPVLVDTVSGEARFQSSFWYLGHFSKFIKPGAARIGAKLDSWMVPAAPDGRIGTMIESTAFRNPDGSIAVVVCNRTEADALYTIAGINGVDEATKRVCPPRAIQTLIIS